MDMKRRAFAGSTAVMIAVAAVAVIAVGLFALGVFSPTAPVNGGLAACESSDVEAGVRDMVAAEDAGLADSIVSVQEIGRQQTENAGPVMRRDCQVTFRTADGYHRVVVHLIAEEGGQGWRLEPGEVTEPPVAAPVEGAPRPTPPEGLPTEVK